MVKLLQLVKIKIRVELPSDIIVIAGVERKRKLILAISHKKYNLLSCKN